MFKIRSSAASQIMTNPKAKKDKLSETCMTHVREKWISDKYKREKDFNSLAIQKGLMNEDLGITELSLHLGGMLTKNNKHYTNDFITGTPDVITWNTIVSNTKTISEGTVFDIKCSYNIWTFAKAELTKAYDWQIKCYMDLLGIKKGYVVYVLTDTPESIIQAELRSILWKLQDDADALEIEAGLRKELTYPDIPAKDKIKIFQVEHSEDAIKNLYDRVELCREYYDTLSL